MAEIHPTATVYEGTVLGEGVKVLEGAVVGKQPTLSPRSTAKREPLAPAVLGDGTIVSTGAIVFAGAQVGARVILGDQSCVRERVEIGDDVVLGRGSYVENDTTIGAMTKIQAEAYITAYSTLEEHVFIAPCVVTTNDNWMGRTEKRFGNVKGPTIRRGARIGGGAILCPGIEIGEEAFVGAGAVVTKDVPARTVVVGNPARVLREVPDEELLENQLAPRALAATPVRGHVVRATRDLLRAAARRGRGEQPPLALRDPLAHEDDSLPVRRPVGDRVDRRVVGYPDDAAPVGIHDVDLEVAVAHRVEGDPLPTGDQEGFSSKPALVVSRTGLVPSAFMT